MRQAQGGQRQKAGTRATILLGTIPGKNTALHQHIESSSRWDVFGRPALSPMEGKFPSGVGRWFFPSAAWGRAGGEFSANPDTNSFHFVDGFAVGHVGCKGAPQSPGTCERLKKMVTPRSGILAKEGFQCRARGFCASASTPPFKKGSIQKKD